jgi:hypothetical protein
MLGPPATPVPDSPEPAGAPGTDAERTGTESSVVATPLSDNEPTDPMGVPVLTEATPAVTPAGPDGALPAEAAPAAAAEGKQTGVSGASAPPPGTDPETKPAS